MKTIILTLASLSLMGVSTAFAQAKKAEPVVEGVGAARNAVRGGQRSPRVRGNQGARSTTRGAQRLQVINGGRALEAGAPSAIAAPGAAAQNIQADSQTIQNNVAVSGADLQRMEWTSAHDAVLDNLDLTAAAKEELKEAVINGTFVRTPEALADSCIARFVEAGLIDAANRIALGTKYANRVLESRGLTMAGTLAAAPSVREEVVSESTRGIQDETGKQESTFCEAAPSCDVFSPASKQVANSTCG